MSDSVEKIKEHLSILDVVSPYVELHKAGKSYKGKSPFTSEKTPSFYVSPDRGMYYCFSSNQGGDIFTFIEKMEGVDFKGALKILAEKAGVELVAEDPKKRSERDSQYALIEDACKFFFNEGRNNKIADDYIEERGVDGKSTHIWRVGFAPDAWRSLREHLLEKKYTDAQILQAGLIKKTDGGKEPYDVFRNRIMFPIADSSGRVVAFSGRTLASDPEAPKYVNSPETELYQKSEILFGYDKAKQGIRSLDFSLIVEGQFDLVLAHQAGYSNTIAVSGTAMTGQHVALLQRLSNRAVLALDSDRAGIAAVKRSAGIMLGRGMDVKVVAISGGKDPADIIKEDAKQFRKMVGEAKHVIEFLLAVLAKNTKDERAYKLQVREELVPLLARMPNHIDREHFEGVVAEALQTTKDAIHYEVERITSSSKEAPHRDGVPVLASGPSLEVVETALAGRERYLFAVMKFLQGVKKHAYVAKHIEEKLRVILGEHYEEVSAELTDEVLNQELLHLEREYESELGRGFFDDVASKLSKYHADSLKRQLSTCRQAIGEMERGGDTGKEYTTLVDTAVRLTGQLGSITVSTDELLQIPSAD